MTATLPSHSSYSEASPPVAAHAGQIGIKWLVLDTLTVTKRNLIAYTRIPEAVFFSSVQPIMFVLLFRYVFGGAIKTPGYSYAYFLIPGIRKLM